MTNRGIHLLSAALATLLTPVAALAQQPASVTTSPLGQPAPTLGAPLIVLLAAILAGVGVYCVRRGRSAAMLTLVLAAMVAVAGIGYATVTKVVISGGDCLKVTVNSYDPTGFAKLESDCPNQIKIIDLQSACTPPDIAASCAHDEPADTYTLAPCETGLILNDGDHCRLPRCCPT